MIIQPTQSLSQTPPKTVLSAADRLTAAGKAYLDLPMGEARSAAFKKAVMPILLEDMTGLLKLHASQQNAILPILEKVVDLSGQVGAGLKDAASADNDYPPKIAQAVWPEFAKALELNDSDARKVQSFCKDIGKLKEVEGLYCPDPQTLSSTEKNILLNAAYTFLGKDCEKTKFVSGFQALLPLINFCWHTTNFQRAAQDESRVDPQKREGVYNVFSDNLRIQSQKEKPEEALLIMVLKDIYNYGKPSIQPLAFEAPLNLEGQARRLENLPRIPQTGEGSSQPGALGSMKLGE